MKKGTISKHSLKFTVWLFFLLLMVACSGFSIFAQSQIRLKQQRAQANLESQGAKAQFMVEGTLHKLDTLKVFVQLSQGDLEQFEETAALILEDRRVRNIALAPDCVISQVFPLEGNEDAIGLDLLSEDNVSRTEAQLAVETRELTIAGPYQLIQGGRAITGRLPVYLKEQETEKFWGLVTITLDMENLFDGIGMDQLWDEEGYLYEFYHYDPNTGEKEILTQRGGVQEERAVEVELPVLNDIWYLRACPQTGWLPMAQIKIFVVICLVMDALICTLVYLLLYIRDEWKERASRDSLTQLYNHQSMENMAKGMLGKLAQKKLAYMMIDLDNFKIINDTLGHHTGDEVLVMTANALKQSVGSSALVARPGGDEFSALVPCNDMQEIQSIAELICDNVKRRIDKNGQHVDVSCSIGIAIYPDHADTWVELNQFADKALYDCKNGDKGCYRIYEEENI